jgi:hypothetical protein
MRSERSRHPVTTTIHYETRQMRNTRWLTGATLLALALAAGCAEGTAPADVSGPSFKKDDGGGKVYEQVEFLGNPLVSEVTIVKARHDAYNRTMPYNPASFRAETESFIVNVAGRPAGYAATVAGVLYSTGFSNTDMLIVDSSKPANSAGWLSWALAGGYGGRKLSDDVVDVGLIAIFSSLLSPVGASCAPGQLPLCTDNVDANDKPFGSTFPYLASPTL